MTAGTASYAGPGPGPGGSSARLDRPSESDRESHWHRVTSPRQPDRDSRTVGPSPSHPGRAALSGHRTERHCQAPSQPSRLFQLAGPRAAAGGLVTAPGRALPQAHCHASHGGPGPGSPRIRDVTDSELTPRAQARAARCPSQARAATVTPHWQPGCC